jgi:hypothetical protein
LLRSDQKKNCSKKMSALPALERGKKERKYASLRTWPDAACKKDSACTRKKYISKWPDRALADPAVCRAAANKKINKKNKTLHAPGKRPDTARQHAKKKEPCAHGREVTAQEKWKNQKKLAVSDPEVS